MKEFEGSYPNSPLVEVVFEIRFPDEPSVDCKRDVFYETIRGSFPRVLVPTTKEGGLAALEPYRFESEDKKRVLMIAMNRFAYSARQYARYEQFAAEALKWVILFSETYELPRLNRTGLRYINIIRFSREGGLIPLHRFLKVKIDLPESFPDDFENLSLAFHSRTDGGSITTKIEKVIAADSSHEAILLDFDYAKDKDLRMDHIEEYLEESHANTKSFFEGLITEQYRQYLKGEVL